MVNMGRNCIFFPIFHGVLMVSSYRQKRRIIYAVISCCALLEVKVTIIEIFGGIIHFVVFIIACFTQCLVGFFCFAKRRHFVFILFSNIRYHSPRGHKTLSSLLNLSFRFLRRSSTLSKAVPFVNCHVRTTLASFKTQNIESYCFSHFLSLRR